MGQSHPTAVLWSQADPFLQFFADNAKMQNCMESIFGLVMNGGTPPAGQSFSSKLRTLWIAVVFFLGSISDCCNFSLGHVASRTIQVASYRVIVFICFHYHFTKSKVLMVSSPQLSDLVWGI